ncbi:hypothetical protein LIS82_08995 [Cytobacillus solani]|uniref:hypothetical protein n=1 Tax=Cytobacillus solani TaxID=1637975 RepID=UPI00207A5CD1|nr:hypothetical protein [Cytobacillus solani]USK56588.1 hypothetical protein LIS82_08995 [Cytobacillus solani]
MDEPLGFTENGVNYYIFATEKSVTVIGMSSKFIVQAKGETFKETLAEAKELVAKKAPLN